MDVKHQPKQTNINTERECKALHVFPPAQILSAVWRNLSYEVFNDQSQERIFARPGEDRTRELPNARVDSPLFFFAIGPVVIIYFGINLPFNNSYVTLSHCLS